MNFTNEQYWDSYDKINFQCNCERDQTRSIFNLITSEVIDKTKNHIAMKTFFFLQM